MKQNPFVYFGKKLLIFLLSILALSITVFLISRFAPGDPLVSYYGERTEKMSVAEKQAAREKLGLNDPVFVQYARWLKNAAQGDFGNSYRYKMPVTQVIGQRIGFTLILGGLGYVLTFLGALLLGIVCAWFEERWIDKILCKIGTFLSCIPEFWLSVVLILLFSVTLRLLPGGGAYDIGRQDDLANRIDHLILPLSVVVLQHLWYYAYTIRNRLLEESRADYVLLGKAKGLSRLRLMLCHCLPNVLPTLVNLMAISVAHVLGQTYVVETVFSYPGIGALTYESARFHDYNLLMVLSIMTGITVIFCNMLSSILSERIDPRIRSAEVTEL